MNAVDARIMLDIIRSAVSAESAAVDPAAVSSDALEGILKSSAKYDLSHLVAFGLKKNRLLPDSIGELDNYILKAFYRCEQTRCELERTCGILERAEIPFMPLKGSVLRDYYPESWMRTSCDIDILVRAADLERAKNILVCDNGYVYHGECSHDISLFTPGRVHLELHHGLIEEEFVNVATTKTLGAVWDYAKAWDGWKYRYEMTDDMFYFYHIAHMAKHFEGGGCGIRPFIDLWILDRLPGADHAKREELLRQGDLLKFAEAAGRLSRAWFSGEELDATLERMQEYILFGGVYGNNSNMIAVQQQKRGGKFKYVMSKIFMPYDSIKYKYPVLQKHRWLTPVMEVCRWAELVFCGGLRRSAKLIKMNQGVSDDVAKDTAQLLHDVGLL